MSYYKMYSDGGSRGNSSTSPAAIGFVIYDQNDRIVCKGSKYIGKATNNIAEYSALYFGVLKLKDLDCEQVNFYLDSELVVKQMKGVYRSQNIELAKIKEKILVSLKDIKWTINWIPREQNKLADSLVNQELDKIH